jgi:predicted nucleic acid-binding protein
MSYRRRENGPGHSPVSWLGWHRYLRPNSIFPRILPVDLPVVRRCASLQVPDRRPVTDALIAATALVQGFTVVTRNVRDFEPMNVPLIDPWLTSDKQA